MNLLTIEESNQVSGGNNVDFNFIASVPQESTAMPMMLWRLITGQTDITIETLIVNGHVITPPAA